MPQTRFGIGEWYGQVFSSMAVGKRKDLARWVLKKKDKNDRRDCPFAGGKCNKAGGVCTIRNFDRLEDGTVRVAGREEGRLRTVCPRRFHEGRCIYAWVGEVVLGTTEVLALKEIGFLRGVAGDEDEEEVARAVGRIDAVLVNAGGWPGSWCALETQAVYFQGKGMKKEFESLRTDASLLPFPLEVRRPDYRSSGVKRFMPQLQIKVPTLRRWGKKMAVVIDEDFFESLDKMQEVSDISNCDVVWFIVGYDRDPRTQAYRLVRRKHVFTTLEAAVTGLTAGAPVALSDFEGSIRSKALEQGVTL